MPWWNPYGWWPYAFWYPVLGAGLLFVGLVYVLDWVSGDRRWGTYLLDWLGA